MSEFNLLSPSLNTQSIVYIIWNRVLRLAILTPNEWLQEEKYC